ncbi:MAG: DNA repair protein RadA [Chitinispirillaceae bacterium]
MPKKSKTAYVCTECGQDYPKWQGRCNVCEQWHTISEFKTGANKQSRPKPALAGKKVNCRTLSECSPREITRTITGMAEFDRVLGGGLVPGATILLGGSPGIGKSTLLLQLLATMAGQGKTVLYVSGEESQEQISLRAHRLGLHAAPMHLLTETSVESIIHYLEINGSDTIVIDSVQTIFSEDLESAPGSVSQVRECAAQLLRYAKGNDTTTFLVGHVTKEGAIAGPRVLEHMVDTVLYFEGDGNYQYRIIRAVKNRFGPSNEIAMLSMSNTGLSPVRNPSELFIMNRNEPQAGTSFVPVLEGTRPLIVELQALVNQTHFGIPQRVASGINPKKLSLLLAVLERWGGIALGDYDIFFNITGGLKIAEPATDLGIAAAVISSFRNQPIRNEVALVGELGLGGEVRPVHNTAVRLKELAAMGFTECITAPVPVVNKRAENPGIKILPCKHIREVQELLF